VVWCGWESNTLRLQECGWKLAVDYRVENDNYTLLVYHEQGQLYGMSNATQLEKRLADAWCEDLPRTFHMTGLARSIEVERFAGIGGSFADFTQIDAQPMQSTRENVRDFNIFNTIATRADEIVIEKADMSVIDHLQAIKDLQSGSQAEIRQRMLDARARGSEDPGPDVEIHTNIVQLRHRV
jgi:hypothetical protein